jgi:stage IV sporulation protein FB
MMTSVLDSSASSRGELRFRIFGIPVRLQPWFWLATVFTAASQDTGMVLIWIAVCFVSILIHELGHVLAFQAYGVPAEAVLYGWGGLAIPTRHFQRTARAQVVISLAGPAAGFCFAGLVVALARSAGAAIHLGFHMLIIPSLTAQLSLDSIDPSKLMNNYYWTALLNDLLYVNIYWGIVNLLPIYPLDGGQASRAIFENHDPARGRRRSLLVSTIVAVAIAVLGLITHSMYLLVMFGILAAGSAQALEQERPVFRRRPGDILR